MKNSKYLKLYYIINYNILILVKNLFKEIIIYFIFLF